MQATTVLKEPKYPTHRIISQVPYVQRAITARWAHMTLTNAPKGPSQTPQGIQMYQTAKRVYQDTTVMPKG